MSTTFTCFWMYSRKQSVLREISGWQLQLTLLDAG